MASLITRLLSRFKTQKRSRRNRRQLDRRLRVEHMEARRLMAGDLGSIAGNVYTDLTDNGYQIGTDPGNAGVTVSLFKDAAGAGAGTLGAEDGAAFKTAVTDVNGNYRFNGLSSIDDTTDQLYFVQQSPATGKLQRTTESVKSVTVTPAMSNGVQATNIDTYTTDTATLTAGPTLTTSGQTNTAVGEALGDQRDIQVNNSTALGGADLSATVQTGKLTISAGAGVTGNVIVSYDGVDASATTIDHTSLPPVNLTANGGEAFQFLAGAQFLGVTHDTLTVDVYSGGANYSSVTLDMPTTVSGLATATLNIPFTSLTTTLGTGVDLTAVTAVRFQVDVAAGQDAEIDFSSVVAPNVTTLNFANLNPMSLGNLVFRDINNNGIKDAGDLGIPGVQVELYQDTNTNGTYDAGTDTAVGTAQTTDANGNYLFTNLLPGEYIALIPISQFATGQALNGLLSSSAATPAPNADINNRDNGTLIAGVGVATAAITLASGAEPTNDGDTDNNSNLTLDFGFAPQIDLGVVKTANVTTVNAGSAITYTLSVTNDGPAAATNVVVKDDLPNLTPTDLTIVSATATGGGVVTQPGNANGEIEVAYTSLAAGQTETITIVVQVPAAAAAAAAITNTATITGEGVEPTPDTLHPNTDNADVAVTRQAVLTLTKTDAPDPNTVGGTLTYQILVTNTGPSTATNVVVSDTLPAGLTYVSSTTTAGTVAEATGVITATIPTLAPSASATVTIVTTIQASFAGSTIPNSATAQADDATQVTANATTAVNPDIDLRITKTDNVDPVNRGGVLIYTLTVVNDGPSGATNVEVVDTLPTDLTFVSAAGGTVTGGTVGSSGPVTINLGAMASGATKIITLTVNVATNAAASISNSAIVRSTESTAGFDRDTTNNTAIQPTATQAVIDLELLKTASAPTVKPGQPLVYTIVVTNKGPSDATLVSLTDNIPDGIQITSATSTVGTVTIPASAQDTTAANTDDLTLNIGNLAKDATVTITVNATVLPGTRGTITNSANVISTDTSLTETITANNTGTVTTTLSPEIDLAITKTDSVDPATAGSPLTYTITVTNSGPSTATGVNVTDNLPTGVTFTSGTSSQGTVTNAAGVVTGNIGTLAPGATATMTIIVGVNAATRGTITNTATVAGTETEPITTNNNASQDTLINGSVDLVITKVDSIDPVAVGGALSYTIEVTNNGPSTATNVVVTDNLPTTLAYVSGNATVGTVTNVGNAVTANVGTLASGAKAIITVNTTVSGTATGTISNTATVVAAEAESNTANNSATQTTALVMPGSISGFAYLDLNRNGTRDTGDTPLPNVAVALSGTETGTGTAITRQTTTDANGAYTFANLLPGTYQIVQTQPTGYKDGQTNVGTGATGTAGTNQITSIQLGSGADAQAFNFGELRPDLSKRRFLASTDLTTP